LLLLLLLLHKVLLLLQKLLLLLLPRLLLLGASHWEVWARGRGARAAGRAAHNFVLQPGPPPLPDHRNHHAHAGVQPALRVPLEAVNVEVLLQGG